MARAFMSVDVSQHGRPVPVLNVNGNQLYLNPSELSSLMVEFSWAANECRKLRELDDRIDAYLAAYEHAYM